MSAASVLVIKAFCQHAHFARFVDAAAAETAKHGGAVVVAEPLHRVTALEPGSIPAHLWIAEFADQTALDTAWASMGAAGTTGLLDQGTRPIVLAMNAVPAAGLPDDFIPTPANVSIPESFLAPAYLVIEGSATDQDRMDKYRDIILPMMKERSSHYTVFELGGSVRVLSGQWADDIFAISKWPSSAFADDFWLSGRYQNDGIPLRLGVGAFSVLKAEGMR